MLYFLNKYERYYGPGSRPLAYLLYYMTTVSPVCRLCINIYHYAPPRIVLQQATAVDATRTAPVSSAV